MSNIVFSFTKQHTYRVSIHLFMHQSLNLCQKIHIPHFISILNQAQISTLFNYLTFTIKKH